MGPSRVGRNGRIGAVGGTVRLDRAERRAPDRPGRSTSAPAAARGIEGPEGVDPGGGIKTGGSGSSSGPWGAWGPAGVPAWPNASGDPNPEANATTTRGATKLVRIDADSTKAQDRWEMSGAAISPGDLATGRVIHRSHCSRRAGVRNRPTVDAANTPTLAELTTEVQDVALQVHQAQERSDERDVVAAAHAGVERLSHALPRDAAVALAGRADEGRTAARTAGGRHQATGVAAAQGPGGRHREHAGPRRGRQRPRRAPDHRRVVDATPSAAAPSTKAKRRRRHRVLVRALRRACTTHSIVAMVGDEPKQVLCQVCGSRHTYRTTPARRAAARRQRRPAEVDDRHAPPIPRRSARRPSCARWAKR